MHFHDTHTSIPINRAEEHNHAQTKVEEGLRLALEVIRRAEEEHTHLEYEEEERLVEEAKLKDEEDGSIGIT